MKKISISFAVMLLVSLGACASMRANKITDTPIHRPVMSAERCMECHLYGDSWTPKCPHDLQQEKRMSCRRCHE